MTANADGAGGGTKRKKDSQQVAPVHTAPPHCWYAPAQEDVDVGAWEVEVSEDREGVLFVD